jgi:predicted esterase
MKTSKILIAILLLCSGHCGYAQQKGSFNSTISFAAENRTLSCFVPLNYDSTQSYRLLVCLHGLGDNSDNYRNVLIQSLGWNGLFTNTIIICPDGGEDQSSDFYSPEGDEGIIEATIDFATQNYSINSDNILLQGFSLGGRSALKYGLEHPSGFKGLLLNTPAFQGPQDVDNDPIGSIGYNYANASQIPMYIFVGAGDLTYVDLVKRAVRTLQKNNAIVQLNVVSSMAHSIPAGPATSKAVSFLTDPVKAGYDLDVFSIESEDRFCSDIKAKCLIRNTGSTPVTSIKLNASYGSTNVTHTWTGSIASYQHAEITLPSLSGNDGIAPLSVSIIDTSNTDSIPANDSFSKTIELVSQTNTVLLEEDFENPNPSWIILQNSKDNILGWNLDESLGIFSTPFFFYTRGWQSDILSPSFSLVGTTDPTLRFDLAFNYLKYAVDTQEQVFADTLEIFISTDCGQSFQRLYKKGGAELATVSMPIINAQSYEQSFYTPSEGEFRQEIIDLKPYAGNDNVYLKFRSVSGMGGTTYIDNMRIGDGMPVGIDKAKPGLSFDMHPNPASQTLNLSITDPDHTRIKIYDSLGKTVVNEYANHNSDSRFTIDLNELSNGFYIVEITNGSEKVSKKLLINK